MPFPIRPVPMPEEIEIRFTLDPKDWPRVLRSATLRRLSASRAKPRLLHSRYYDTADMALTKAGLSLRVRKQGRKFVQTVKTASTGALASVRGEWECPLPGEEPDLRLIADEAIRAQMTELAGDEPMTAMVETEIRRTTHQIKTDGGDEIEIAFDRGEIRTLAGERACTLPVNEVELELRAGTPMAIFDLARALNHETPLVVHIESKAERGWRALEDRTHAPQKAGRLYLPPDATAEEAFRATLLHCIRHLASNVQAIAEARDPEGVHQLRVGLRRLRAGLTAFGPAFRCETLTRLREEAKMLAKDFSATRERDVFVLSLLPPILAAQPDLPGLSAFHSILECARKEAWNDAVLRVRAPSFTQFLLALAESAQTRCWRAEASPESIADFLLPARELAKQSLDKRLAKAGKRAKHWDRMDDAERHELRLALKKLRYSAEFFAPLFARKDAGAFLKPLAKLQDIFGTINDAATARSVGQAVIASAPSDGSPDISQADLREAAAYIAGWHRGQIEPQWENAKKRWKHFFAAERFWED